MPTSPDSSFGGAIYVHSQAISFVANDCIIYGNDNGNTRPGSDIYVEPEGVAKISPVKTDGAYIASEPDAIVTGWYVDGKMKLDTYGVLQEPWEFTASEHYNSDDFVPAKTGLVAGYCRDACIPGEVFTMKVGVDEEGNPIEKQMCFYTCGHPDCTGRYVEVGHEDELNHAFEWCDIEAGCEHGSYSANVCSRCGKIEDATEEVGEALGHAWGEWTVTTEPTCSELGVKTRECDRCGKTENGSVDKTEHNWITIADTDADCTHAGHVKDVCADCGAEGESYEDANAPALGHDWEEVVVSEPTCEMPGVNKEVCRRCGEENMLVKYGRGTLPLGHDWETVTVTDPDCEHAGTVKDVCSRCGEESEVYENEGAPALGHDWHEVVVRDADCEHDGIVKHVCDRCGVETEATDDADGHPALGHDWKYEVVEDPTCETTGKAIETCERCGATHEYELEATGHKWSEWTKDEHGVEHRFCEECGATEETSIGEAISKVVDIDETIDDAPATSSDDITVSDSGESAVTEDEADTEPEKKEEETANMVSALAKTGDNAMALVAAAGIMGVTMATLIAIVARRRNR